MAEIEQKPNISFEEIEKFLNGRNPFKRAISVDITYGDTQAKITYRTEKDEKAIKYDDFYPFVWAKYSICDKMCGGDRHLVKQLLNKYGIEVKKLRTKGYDGTEEERMVNGYKFIFRATHPMSYSTFLKFFKDAGTPVFSDRGNNDDPDNKQFMGDDRPFLSVSPQEQYMIATGTRLFQGYETYDDIHRLLWDIESEGLEDKHRITKIGIRVNKGFEKILTVKGNTKEELDASEKKCIEDFLRIIYTKDPDTIAGHNSENFDWNHVIARYKILGGDFEAFTKELFGGPIYKNPKPTTLKLGGEVETYYQTIVPGHIVLDSLHAARRAQAGDSSMLKADLKYVTKYLSLNKPNRVYIPGDKITTTLRTEGDAFAFNDENGDWYLVDEKHPLKEGYVLKTGAYIVDRYLLDDIWETDKVELQLNQANFLINKIVPTGFARACTMGTAGIWKLIILAWSYEQGLAVPAFGKGGAFTGGLSRLCRTGFIKKVIKLDYNSLYPSIMLTWHIDPKIDIQGVLPAMLNYVLTQRETYKKLKKIGAKNAEAKRKEYKETQDKSLLSEIQPWENEEMKNDRLQNPLKILGNSAFGSFGAENLFPLGDKNCAERITCTGRQSLRLMISHFMGLGYKPIVGDSFTEDTPVFVRNVKNGAIDIKPICELIDENKIETDALGREYDYSPKPYQVLCRSGWVTPSYIYRHKTDKDIYEITDGDMKIEVTEDHSLFNDKKEKIKPSEVNNETHLEYFNDYEVFKKAKWLPADTRNPHFYAKALANGKIDRVPSWFLNRPTKEGREFYEVFIKNYRDDIQYSKTCLAGLYFLKMISEVSTYSGIK